MTSSGPAHQAAVPPPTATNGPQLTYNEPNLTWLGPQLAAHHGAHCVIYHSNLINAAGPDSERAEPGNLGVGQGWGPVFAGDAQSP